MPPISALPLVVNEHPEECPECHESDMLASVYRDGGSQRYCRVCFTVRWPNPEHPRGATTLERLTARGALRVGDVSVSLPGKSRWEEIKLLVRLLVLRVKHRKAVG